MIIDMHVHTTAYETDFAPQLHEAEKFDARLVVAVLWPAGHRGEEQYDVSVELFRDANRQALALCDRFPERMRAWIYVNPAHTREALTQLEQGLRHPAAVGLKLWVARRASDPCLDPLLELCAAERVPVLQHTWVKTGGNLPGESTPEDLRQAALRHPRTIFIMAHCGGDWEYGIKAARDLPNVYVDICGGEAMRGWTERLVAAVGVERVVFGTDMPGRSFPSQLAKVLGARLSDADKERILYRNFAAILQQRRRPGGAPWPA
jgi:predicted TIM-barrel fold metal-dependent hydrolase